MPRKREFTQLDIDVQEGEIRRLEGTLERCLNLLKIEPHSRVRQHDVRRFEASLGARRNRLRYMKKRRI